MTAEVRMRERAARAITPVITQGNAAQQIYNSALAWAEQCIRALPLEGEPQGEPVEGTPICDAHLRTWFTERDQLSGGLKATCVVCAHQSPAEQGEPDAYLVTFRETDKYGDVRCCTMASLEPAVLAISGDEEEKGIRRELIKAEPLYRSQGEPAKDQREAAVDAAAESATHHDSGTPPTGICNERDAAGNAAQPAPHHSRTEQGSEEDRMVQAIKNYTEPAPAREPSAVEELDYLARVQEPCDFNGQAYKHAEELDRLRTELEGARNSANYWKAEHLAGNLEIDRLREQLQGGVVVPRESGSLELGDSPHLLAFMVELHSHLPEGKRPYGWADFSDEQRTRIKRAYDAMLAAAKEPKHG